MTGLTRLTEQAFSLPDDLAYRRHGLHLRGAARGRRDQDGSDRRRLRPEPPGLYARQCVFHALLLGHVSADDLRESTDLWALVTAPGTPSAGASPARMVEYATRGAPAGTGATPIEREIVTCAAAASRMGALWGAEIARASGIFGRRLFPGAANEALARTELMAALPAAHDYLIGASRSAADILRQQMVLNAIHGAGEQWSAEAGNAAALRAYTEARAEAQTVSAYRAIGRQAETWVPMLRIVFECLYVGAFPMAVLLMLTPAGEAICRSYFAGLVWLQSWGPLYAILHRIAMGEAAVRMGAGALMPDGDVGVSLVAQAGIRAVASDVAVMSGYLSMSVPFLAAALAYGVGRTTSLATSVLSVGQDAASSAAQEGTTGNISLANTQADTHRFAAVEGYQLRTSAHVDTDRYTGFAPGGAAYTVTGEGAAVMDAALRHQPHPRGGRETLRITRDQPRGPGGRGHRAGPWLVGRGRVGAHGRRDRFRRHGRAFLTRRENRPHPRQGRDGEPEPERAAARIASRKTLPGRRHHEGAGRRPHGRGQDGRRVRLHRQVRGGRVRELAGTDLWARSLEQDDRLRGPERTARHLVAGGGGFQTLRDRLGRERTHESG